MLVRTFLRHSTILSRWCWVISSVMTWCSGLNLSPAHTAADAPPDTESLSGAVVQADARPDDGDADDGAPVARAHERAHDLVAAVGRTYNSTDGPKSPPRGLPGDGASASGTRPTARPPGRRGPRPPPSGRRPS